VEDRDWGVLVALPREKGERPILPLREGKRGIKVESLFRPYRGKGKKEKEISFIVLKPMEKGERKRNLGFLPKGRRKETPSFQ